jgi:hypothetical protein
LPDFPDVSPEDPTVDSEKYFSVKTIQSDNSNEIKNSISELFFIKEKYFLVIFATTAGYLKRSSNLALMDV